jgi:hypothetical protein
MGQVLRGSNSNISVFFTGVSILSPREGTAEIFWIFSIWGYNFLKKGEAVMKL